MLLPKLIQESIDYYIFREKLANVNAQYMSMYNKLFYNNFTNIDDINDGVYVKDPHDPLPSFFNYRNMRILYDNKIYGIRSNYSRLYKIYTYLRSYVSYLSVLSPVTPITYHVGTLPLRFWYSSGNNYPRGYKDFKFW
jgi:hypothetical protein